MKCRNVFQSLQCQFYYKRCRNCLIIMLSLCTCYAHNLTVYQKICTPLLIFPYINIIPKTWINLYSSFFFGVYCILAGLSVYLIFFFVKLSFFSTIGANNFQIKTHRGRIHTGQTQFAKNTVLSTIQNFVLFGMI